MRGGTAVLAGKLHNNIISLLYISIIYEQHYTDDILTTVCPTVFLLFFKYFSGRSILFFVEQRIDFRPGTGRNSVSG